MSVSWPLPKLQTLNCGLKVPGYVQQEKLDQLKEFELFPDDVWIAAYPKSGTNWTAQIVKLIKNRGVQDNVKLHSAVLFPEMTSPHHEIASMRAVERPRIFTTHFPYPFLPCGSPHTTPCKYVYVVRNPKDVAVSFYFHMKNGWLHDFEWPDFWERFIKGNLSYGDYYNHLLSWLPHRNDKNVLFLQYEDMKRNLSQAVSKMAAFMEIDLSSEMVEKIARLTDFDTMKHDKTANLTWVENFRDENGGSTFLRKGVVGDWKNYLTAEQNAEIDKKSAEKLKGLDIVLKYE